MAGEPAFAGSFLSFFPISLFTVLVPVTMPSVYRDIYVYIALVRFRRPDLARVPGFGDPWCRKACSSYVLPFSSAAPSRAAAPAAYGENPPHENKTK